MNKFNKIFVCLLAFSSVFAISDNDIFAQKKSQSKKNKNKGKNKKSKSKISSALADVGIETRATRGDASTTTTTATSTPTVVMDEATEVEYLADNLMTACLPNYCHGDIQWEKCFKRDQAKSFIFSDTTCKSMYDSASTDIVRLKAMNKINAKMKEYLTEACENAGGKVSGDTCKFKICYYATGGEGSKPASGCRDFKLGQSFTCSYTDFGIDPKDMEYTEKMTSDQIGQVINAGMGLVQGTLTTVVSVVDAVSASKELKAKSNIMGKDCYFIYKKDDNSFTLIKGDVANSCEQAWTKCDTKDCNTVADSCEKANKSQPCNESTDSYGNKYKWKDNGNISAGGGSNYVKSCDSMTAAEWAKLSTTQVNGKDQWGCYVKLSEYTEISKAEKEAELYKKFTDFNKLKVYDAINSSIVGGVSSAHVNTITTKTYKTQDGTDKSCGTTFFMDVSKFNTINAAIEEYNKTTATNTNEKLDPTNCYLLSSNTYACKYINADARCQYDSSNKRWWIPKQTEFNTDYVDGEGEYKDNKGLNADLKAYTDAMEGLATNQYSSAVSTYNSKMKSVNEKKDEIASLKERKTTGMANAIGAATTTLVQQGSALTTTLISASKNKGIKIGNCYIGGLPSENGQMFTPENVRKKLSWKNL